MGVPVKKSTKSSKKSRASHFALKTVTLAKCSKCKKPVLSHHVCKFCGTYAGKEVIDVKSKLEKKKRKRKERGQNAKKRC